MKKMAADPERKWLDNYKRAMREIEELLPAATGQTIAKAALRVNRVTPLARLTKAGRLNVWEYTAACEIVSAHAISQGLSYTRDPGLGIRAEMRIGQTNAEEVRRIDTLDKFREWQSDLKQTRAMRAVVDVLLNEHSLHKTERENRWENGTAFRHLRDGLRHFAALRGNVPKGERWRYEH